MHRGQTLLICGVILFVLAGLLITRKADHQPSLRVAAASSLRATLPEIIASYNDSYPGQNVRVTYAASGTLAAAIERGAPFDLFLSADQSRPSHLQELGLLTSPGVQPFATSHVVFLRRGSTDEKPTSEWPVIAIPNPKFAPYGRVAMDWLEAHPDFGTHKLVYADSVANAAGLFQAGAVDGVFLDPQHTRRLMDSQDSLAQSVIDAPTITLTASVMKRASHPVQADQFVLYLRKHWHDVAN